MAGDPPSDGGSHRGGSELIRTVVVWVLAAIAFIPLALQADAAGAGPPITFLASSLACAALPAALRHPIPATLLQAVAVVALGLGASEQAEPSAQIPLVAAGLVAAQVGVVAFRHDWRVAVGVWWTLNGVAVLLAAIDDRVTVPDATVTLSALAAVSLLVLLGGLGYRQRMRIRDELASARQDVVVEQERRALAEERARIARELHDVVAHSMSVIHMQATSAPYRHSELDQAMKAEFRTIAEGARGALGEMRQLLGLLRGSDAEPQTSPAPGIADLPGLVEPTSRSGARCDLEVDPDLGEVPGTVDTTVYRIVQEALSNVMRHAHGAAVAVRVGRERDGVAVTVVNGPGGTGLDGDDRSRIRLGLIGMGERVDRLGGELSHGAQPGGGFRVAAWLPDRSAPRAGPG